MAVKVDYFLRKPFPNSRLVQLIWRWPIVGSGVFEKSYLSDVTSNEYAALACVHQQRKTAIGRIECGIYGVMTNFEEWIFARINEAGEVAWYFCLAEPEYANIVT
ncbi:hypothetical protein N7454_004509 [Penicillium verhagenii]|nr:hypothetical protein N7454_004509 [Penicillium verhagenii]